MTLQQFLTAIQFIVSLDPAYKLGHSGDDGFCDCIGLIIGAVKHCGVSWSGLHGSNWTARHEVSGLRKVSRASDLKLGDIVFKAYEPNASGWDLPDRYQADPDQRDYYHVGIVTHVSPLEITHMTTPSVKVDTKLGKWSYAGTLEYIKEKEKSITMNAVIISDDGYPVKLRPTASTSQPYVEKIPVGTSVSVLEKGEEWSKITALGKTGYIMTKFLRFNDGSQVFVTLTLPADVASALRDALNTVV